MSRPDSDAACRVSTTPQNVRIPEPAAFSGGRQKILHQNAHMLNPPALLTKAANSLPLFFAPSGIIATTLSSWIHVLSQITQRGVVMLKLRASKLVYVLAGCLLFLAGWLVGQQRRTTEKTVIQAVAWTTLESATAADFENFRKSTAELVGVMPGLRRAWVGKLRMPLIQGDQKRTYGMVFEFDDAKSRETGLGRNTPAAWAALRDKIRLEGQTNHTTFDIIGE